MCQECLELNEFHKFLCFNLRCFVQPLPVITLQMLQTLADNTKFDHKSVCETIDKAKQFHAMRGNSRYYPIARNLNQSQRFQKFVSVTPPILAKKQRMQFDYFNKSDACEDVTCYRHKAVIKNNASFMNVWHCVVHVYGYMMMLYYDVML